MIIGFSWFQGSPDDICGTKYDHWKNGSHWINNSAVNKSCLTLTGDIPPGIPTPSIPEGIDDGELIKSLIAPAIVVALIGYLESIAIAKAFARQNGYEVQPSQELIAIGFGNIISGFFSSYPVTGSFSRTAVNSASGVASPASGLVTGAVVLLALQFATKVMEYIPAAALASIIIVSVIKMFNYQIVFKMLKVNPIDAIPWAVSFFLCTFKDIKWGVGIGMGVNILIQLYMSARPTHSPLVVDERTLVYRPKTEQDEENEEIGNIYEDVGYTNSKITVMRVGGSLFFSAGNSWKEAVRTQLKKDNSRALVLDYSACAGIDFSGVQAVLECTDDCQKMKVRVYSTGMLPAVHKMLQRAGYWKYGGSAGVESYPMLPDAIASAEAYVMEFGVESASLVDSATPLLNPVALRPGKQTKTLGNKRYSGLVGSKMSGVGGAPDINSIN